MCWSEVHMPPVGRTGGGRRDPLTGLLQPIWLRYWPEKALSPVQLQSDYNLYTTTDHSQLSVTAAIWLRTDHV